MKLTLHLLAKNSIVVSVTITLTLFVGLFFCYPSSFSFAQTYTYDPYFPSSNINPYNPYSSSSNINPYNPYFPSSNINPYNPYFPSSNIYPPQNNFPFLGLAQFGIRQAVSPWFPSIPAISCGLGKFSFNVLGVPDKGTSPEKDELMAIKVIASNNGLIITDRDVSGLIFVGEKNIEENDGEDFDIKTLFNDCQTLMYSR
jgi:hypothetical protein